MLSLPPKAKTHIPQRTTAMLLGPEGTGENWTSLSILRSPISSLSKLTPFGVHYPDYCSRQVKKNSRVGRVETERRTEVWKWKVSRRIAEQPSGVLYGAEEPGFLDTLLFLIYQLFEGILFVSIAAKFSSQKIVGATLDII